MRRNEVAQGDLTWSVIQNIDRAKNMEGGEMGKKESEEGEKGARRKKRKTIVWEVTGISAGSSNTRLVTSFKPVKLTRFYCSEFPTNIMNKNI
jgi:hypothetical protein